MRAFGTKLQRPQWPRSTRGAFLGRHGHDFKLMYRFRLLPVASPEAIRACIATADDHNALACRKNLVRHHITSAARVLLRQELHREINSLEFPSRNFQVTWIFSASGQQDSVELLAQILRGNISAHVGSRLELNAFRRHLLEPPVKNFLFQLEVRNTIAE